MDNVRILTVRHPDGGFRRFEQVDDGRGLVIVDGADEARIEFANDVLEVTVATDRYRFRAAATNAGTSD